jgi:hypothetical protein
VYFRSGWRVRAFDFAYFEELYDVRIVLECAALARLEQLDLKQQPLIEEITRTWRLEPSHRLRDAHEVSALDERFHCALVEAAGNGEMTRMHREITEKIRIIRQGAAAVDPAHRTQQAGSAQDHAAPPAYRPAMSPGLSPQLRLIRRSVVQYGSIRFSTVQRGLRRSATSASTARSISP